MLVCGDEGCAFRDHRLDGLSAEELQMHPPATAFAEVHGQAVLAQARETNFVQFCVTLAAQPADRGLARMLGDDTRDLC
jgi:hypothetical protein